MAFDMLEYVKMCLGIMDDFHNVTIQNYITEVQEYLQAAGIPETVTKSAECGGIVVRGVSDLWNYGSGGAALSPYFYDRASQLALKWGAIANAEA